MKKRIIIDANFPTETRVVLLDKNNNIENAEFHSENKKYIKGNIYLGKITRVEPSLQSAFVDYGEDKSGFLSFDAIHSHYYNIPHTDKQTDSLVGEKIDAPKITSEDLAEKRKKTDFHELIENDEIDINTVTKMVDNRLSSNINIEADENDIDTFSNKSTQEEKQYKIQEVIKKGQIVLVQVTKEERGNKGATLTTYISLAGKYCVLMPNTPFNMGISRKISNIDERKRLKQIISNLIENENSKLSIIARTAAAGHTTLEIKQDYDYLIKLWNKIRETTLKSNAPSFIHQEDGILLQTIRDMFTPKVKEIIIQGTKAYNIAYKFMSDILPKELKSIKEYKGKIPIYTKFGIEDQLIDLYQSIVSLPSGGYIVINPTEALISIDVNSGKNTSERDVENMALKTNLEAAREIARQAQLRDLSGLLVIDFIDLVETKNKKILERSVWEYFSKDKARIQTSSISEFGLLEMSRQRLRPSFLEVNSNMCSNCSGKGVIRADESNSMLILRTIENEIYNAKQLASVNIYGIASSIIYLLNNKRTEIESIENKYSIKLNFFIDKNTTSDIYSIEKVRAQNKKKPVLQALPALQNIPNKNLENDNTDNKPQKKATSTKKTTAKTLPKNDTKVKVEDTDKAQTKIQDQQKSDDTIQEEKLKKPNNKKRIYRKKIEKTVTSN